MRASNCASTNALRTSSSDDALKGSTLKRTSPEKEYGVLRDHADTSSRNGIDEHRGTSTPSTLIELPEEGGANRNKANKNDDFPEPVLPTKANFVPPSTENVSPFNTRGSSGLYLNFSEETSKEQRDLPILRRLLSSILLGNYSRLVDDALDGDRIIF